MSSEGFFPAHTAMKWITFCFVILTEGAAGGSAGTVAEDSPPGVEGEQDDPG